MRKINVLDLFAGCGGLTDGFEQAGGFHTLACIEWEARPAETLQLRLEKKWRYKNAKNIVLRYDMQRTKELLAGWNDPEYGQNPGLNKIISDKKVDVIVGGPPCQAYSMAGRVRDENGMQNDYRNYLFESYLKLVVNYKPDFFIFENVPGILSAKPGGISIINRISNEIKKIGYTISNDLKKEALFDASDFGVPQSRKRVIIFGVNKTKFSENSNEIISSFYDSLAIKSRAITKQTVHDAISDLPRLLPLNTKIGKPSHQNVECDITDHVPRFHSKRDIKIFKLLAQDIESRKCKYVSVEAIKKLYEKETGRNSSVHKYYVLRWDRQSNTIPAHLYKDGLRHIHPDSAQGRSLTIREAARLQTFDDDYEFVGSMSDKYKMIGNAVPPIFARVIAESILKIYSKYN